MTSEPSGRRSVDVRTRRLGAVEAISAAEFFEHRWPAAMGSHGVRAADDAQRLGLRPLTLVVDDDPWTLVPATHTITAHHDRHGDAHVVQLELGAFQELVAEQRSALGLVIGGRCRAEPQANEAFCIWDAVLRSGLDGRGLYRPGEVPMLDRAGAPLDLGQRFRLGERAADAGHFLAEAGFCVLEGVFSADEMDAVDAEMAAAVAAARPDDGTSWWATTRAGERYPCRILDLTRQSPTLTALLDDARVLAIGALLADGHRPGDPFGEHFSTVTAEGLTKRVDSVEGFSVLPWHKDCDRGGHSMYCCGLTIGICLTPVDEAHGGLDVLAGSHRANLTRSQFDRGLDLPAISLRAARGDVSVHCSCTVHRSTHPTTHERRVAYSGLSLPLQAGDRHAEAAQGRLRRERAALGDPTMGSRFADPDGSDPAGPDATLPAADPAPSDGA